MYSKSIETDPVFTEDRKNMVWNVKFSQKREVFYKYEVWNSIYQDRKEKCVKR